MCGSDILPIEKILLILRKNAVSFWQPLLVAAKTTATSA